MDIRIASKFEFEFEFKQKLHSNRNKFINLSIEKKNDCIKIECSKDSRDGGSLRFRGHYSAGDTFKLVFEIILLTNYYTLTSIELS